MDLAKHAGCTNSGDYKSNWIKSNLVFWETRVPGGKNPKNRVEKQQIQSTYDSGSGYRTRAILVEGEYHCANTAHVFNNIPYLFTYKAHHFLRENMLVRWKSA